MKLAILGGSFNPIHLGHIALAEAAHKELSYDKIAIIPAFISPFKKETSPIDAKERLKMIDLAIKDIPYLYCEPYEIEKEGISYTSETIDYLYKKFYKSDSGLIIGKHVIEGKIGLIIGEDLAYSIPKWKNTNKIISLTDIIIGRRLSYKKKHMADLKKLTYPFIELKNKINLISSTQVRTAILNKKEFKHLVPSAVYEYIIQMGLY